MLQYLLSALLFCSALGDGVQVDEEYKGEECNRILPFYHYMYYKFDKSYPTDDNGDPNYMWGYDVSNGDKLVCCYKLTSDKTIMKVTYDLVIPKEKLENMTLTRIQVLDQNEPYKSGFVTIFEPVPGKDAMISFTAMRGGFLLMSLPMSYVISVWRKPDNQSSV